MSSDFRCGFAAVVGRPNVGKSTLVNRLLGHKLSITSRKPQTTRHRILGIKTTRRIQCIYVDTPGIHAGRGRALNRYMNRAAVGALLGVDVILFLVEASEWTVHDAQVLERLAGNPAPILLVLNKIDLVGGRERLLPAIEDAAGRGAFAEVVPVSARRGTSVARLEKLVEARLPAGPPVFPEGQFTDRSERFLAAEIVREKLTRRLGQELPYRLSVEIEGYAEEGTFVRIGALIWVEQKGQKGIVIGHQGRILKAIGTQARRDLERMLGCKVHLDLWVKVKEGWSDSARALRSLGYVE